MRQVPVSFSYLIIGRGRLARHLRHYFDLKLIPYLTWDRSSPRSDLITLAQNASHCLLAISDSAVEPFYLAHPEIHALSCVHFSGALTSPLIPSAHPLMSFSERLYELDDYERIPFVVEQEGPDPVLLLPGLANRFFKIPRDQKTLYHALCAMSGNFTVLLWEHVAREFKTSLGLPPEILLPYLQTIAENLTRARLTASVLTGPLARGDHGTIHRHLEALEPDSFGQVYRAFIDAYALDSHPRKPTPTQGAH